MPDFQYQEKGDYFQRKFLFFSFDTTDWAGGVDPLKIDLNKILLTSKTQLPLTIPPPPPQSDKSQRGRNLLELCFIVLTWSA